MAKTDTPLLPLWKSGKVCNIISQIFFFGARILDYIIVDFEWNQPQFAVKTDRPSPSSEIIQIGAVKTDSLMNRKDSFKILIKPVIYRKMNRRVEKLTGIHNEDIQNGMPFRDAAESFIRWCGTDFSFITWGPSDRDVLESNLRYHGMDTEWIPETYDAQFFFSRQITDDNVAYSLDNALYLLDEKGMPSHDSLCDAENTYTVLRHINIEEAISDYRAYTRDTAGVMSGYFRKGTPYRSGTFDFRCTRCSKRVYFPITGYTGPSSFVSKRNCSCSQGYIAFITKRKSSSKNKTKIRMTVYYDTEKAERMMKERTENYRKKYILRLARAISKIKV